MSLPACFKGNTASLSRKDRDQADIIIEIKEKNGVNPQVIANYRG